MIHVVYVLALALLSIFSFGFVDANFPVRFFPEIFRFVHTQRPAATVAYTALILLLFTEYAWILSLVRKNALSARRVAVLLFGTAVIAFLSFPGFSYDVFNYIATAKVTYLYKENPYLVMPIEIPNEPMLSFLHASNKIALYGPLWIIFTAAPHFTGLGNLVLTTYAFKMFAGIFWIATLILLWKMTNRNLFAVAFFGLNPLVLIETWMSAHNDIVMMFLALLSWYALQKKKFFAALALLVGSVLVKYATVVLLPVYVFVYYRNIRHRPIDRNKVTLWCLMLLFIAFLLSPIREEIYPWYFIWPMTFLTLVPNRMLLLVGSVGLSMGLSLRFAPFVYAGEWGRFVPAIKKIVTILPPMVLGLLYELRKKI